MTFSVSVYFVVILMLNSVDGNPICQQCKEGHYLQRIGCKCLRCPHGEYNTTPGWALWCEPCRKYCHDDSQTKVKECDAEHDIYCQCPKGKHALTQQDMCYDDPGQQNLSPKRPSRQPGPPDRIPVGPDPKENESLKRKHTVTPSTGRPRDKHPIVPVYKKDDDQKRNKKSSAGNENETRGGMPWWRMGLLIAVCIITTASILGALFIFKWKQHQGTGDPKYEDKQPPILRAECMFIAKAMLPKDAAMFLRTLPMLKLTESEIEDLKNRCSNNKEFVYQGLQKWLSSQSNATAGHLVETLKVCQLNRMAMDLQHLSSRDKSSLCNVVNAPAEKQMTQPDEELKDQHPGIDNIKKEIVPLLDPNNMEPRSGPCASYTPPNDINTNPYQDVVKLSTRDSGPVGENNPDWIGNSLHKSSTSEYQEGYKRPVSVQEEEKETISDVANEDDMSNICLRDRGSPGETFTKYT